jgi:hypothetical protein
MIDSFGEDIKRMTAQIDAQCRESEILGRDNCRLTSELDELRMREAKHAQLRISLEEET